MAVNKLNEKPIVDAQDNANLIAEQDGRLVRIPGVIRYVDALKDDLSHLYPYDENDVLPPGMEIVVGLELYGADPGKDYGLPVVRFLPNGDAIIRVMQTYPDGSWDTSVGAVCEYRTDSFTYDPNYTLHKVRLEQSEMALEHGVNVYGYAYLAISEDTNVNQVGLRIDECRINRRCIAQSAAAALNESIDNRMFSYDYSLICPNVIRVNSGSALIFYPNQMAVHRELFDRPETVFHMEHGVEANSSQLDGKSIGIFFPDAAGTQELTFHTANVERDGRLSSMTEKKIKVGTISKPTGKNVKVLAIGDSFLDFPWISSSSDNPGHVGDGVLTQVKALGANDGNTISYVGTHLSYDGIYTESYGGWNETSFESSGYNPYQGQMIRSPFYLDNITLNFQQYFASNGTPDVVVFHLGMNGGMGEGINRMIAAIKAASPSTKFVVCTVPPYFAHRYNVDFYNGEKARAEQNLNYLRLFDGREPDGIVVCPIHMFFHRELHYIWTERSVTSYSDNPEIIRVCTNHHPNPDGAKTLARAIYNYITRWLI